MLNGNTPTYINALVKFNSEVYLRRTRLSTFNLIVPSFNRVAEGEGHLQLSTLISGTYCHCH